MSAGKYREKIYRQVHENVASLNDYSLRIVGMSDLGLRKDNIAKLMASNLTNNLIVNTQGKADMPTIRKE